MSTELSSDKISVMSVDIEPPEEYEHMFPSRKTITVTTTEVATKILSENLSAFVTNLGRVLDRLPQSCGEYNVDTLTFSANVNGSGSVSLVGQISAGISAGITITLKRLKP